MLVVVCNTWQKKNLGTTIDAAEFVIGVGPGFTAGKDCHVVVETMRGHNLGKVIHEGCAIPNTGIPAEIGGYSIERIIRASADGLYEPVVKIGDHVEKESDCCFIAGGKNLSRALMSGIVRGNAAARG